MRKQRIRRRGDGKGAHHPVAGWLHGNDDDENDDDGRYRDKDGFQHRFLVIKCGLMERARSGLTRIRRSFVFKGEHFLVYKRAE